MKQTGLAGRIVLLLLMLILLPLCAMAVESPKGRVKVLGYEDDRSTCTKMWAPMAIMTSKAHVSDLYLEYRYARFDSENRVWQMMLVDEDGHRKEQTCKLDIIFPYPCKWNSKTNSYWKWTQDYADRYQWAYAVVFSRFSYEREQLDSKAGYILTNPKPELLVKHKGYTLDEYTDPYKLIDKRYNENFGKLMKGFKNIEPNDEYGFRLKQIKVKNGYLPHICIQTFKTTHYTNDCEKKLFLGQIEIEDYIVDYFETLQWTGFLLDDRPKKYQNDPDFMTFLERRESMVEYDDFQPRVQVGTSSTRKKKK